MEFTALTVLCEALLAQPILAVEAEVQEAQLKVGKVALVL
tara:strand:+ start:1551 stop:1670 length:120 start_codon:yes stop_codon:yes gene_type:complete